MTRRRSSAGATDEVRTLGATADAGADFANAGRAGDFLAGAGCFAGAFFAGAAFLIGATFLVGAVFFATLSADFTAGLFFAGAFFAGALLTDALFFFNATARTLC